MEHCDWEVWPPADHSSNPGIMSHNVMLRSDWHSERHRGGREEGLLTEREKKGERERDRHREIMMMMMRVMMRGHEPKQRQNKKKVRINLCLPPHFMPPLSPLRPASLCQHQTHINHTTIYPIPLSLSITFYPPFLVLCFSVICSQCL